MKIFCLFEPASMRMLALEFFTASITLASNTAFCALVTETSQPAGLEQHVLSQGVGRSGNTASVLARLPVEFEANRGQHDSAVLYLARGPSYRMFLTASGPVFNLPAIANAPTTVGKARFDSIGMRFVGGNRSAEVTPLQQSAHKTNYFAGDASRHRADIPNFERVAYKNIYPGVDVVFYGKGGLVEYDFVLQPGADPAKIELAFSGAKKIEVDTAGDLVVTAASGTLRQHLPAVYQEANGERKPIQARYRVTGKDRVKFQVAAYDSKKKLVIDPILSYSTYLGGSAYEEAYGMAVDAAGNAYITGQTQSADFPTAGPYQRSLAGVQDVFVAKLNPSGTGLIYSTYIGGRRGGSAPSAIAIGADGSAYVAGATSSDSYPVTTGAYSLVRTSSGGFITKLNPAGNALSYSTFFPVGYFSAIRVDEAGNAYVAGHSGPGLPTTPGAYQTTTLAPATYSNGFVTKLNAAGSALVYSTYLGGGSNDQIKSLAIDGAGNAYVAGYTSSTNFPLLNASQWSIGGTQDGFVSKLNPAGTALVFSTYLGGGAADTVNAIAVDAAGVVYVAGDTYSADFPVVQGASKPEYSTAFNSAFITKMAADGASLIWSTYFGGRACLSSVVFSCVPSDPNDGATAIAVDPAGTYVYVAGYLSSVDVAFDYPIQASLRGPMDAFVAKMENGSSARFLYSTRLGGSGTDKAVGIGIDAKGNAYVAGTSSGALDFPTTAGALKIAAPGGSDVFVSKLSTNGAPISLAGPSGMVSSIAELQFKATLGNLNAAGTVTFKDGQTVLATIPIVGSTASYTTTLSAGVHSITAVFDGDGSVSRPLDLYSR